MDDKTIEKIRTYLGTKYNLVGVKIHKTDGATEGKGRKPRKKMRFCQMVKEAAGGNSFAFDVDDLDCPSAMVTLGFEEPVFGDLQPRINPSETKLVEVSPVQEFENPDVILAVLNPKQAMDIAVRIDGIEAKFKGEMAVCGEATAQPYMTKKPNVTVLCGGARKFSDYKESELIFGATPETYEKLAEKIPSKLVTGFKKLIGR